MTTIDGVDHAVIMAVDLAAAAETYRRLGFTVSARAVHSGLGTANHVFVFERDYAELLGVVEPGPANQTYQAALAAGEGLAGLALRCTSAEAARAELVGLELEASETLDFTRSATIGDRTTTAAFRITSLGHEATPGFFTFACEHRTPEAVWHPEAIDHPNGALGIAEVFLTDPEPAATAQRYSTLAEVGPLESDGAAGSVGAVGASEASSFWWIGLEPGIRVGTPEAFAGRFPGLRPGRDGARARPLGFSLRVRSLDDAVRLLELGGVEARRTRRGSVWVPPRQACGVLLELVEGVAGG